MAFINYETQQIQAKVVWYGPEAVGKTASLRYMWERTSPANARTVEIEPPPGQRTAYYDYLPMSLGEIRGYKSTFGLYTVPGAPGFAGSRRALLEKVDGLVFTADARPDRQQDNLQSLHELRQSLAGWGFALDKLPLVIQCTFTDVLGSHPPAGVAEPLLAGQPNAGSVPVIASVPPQGIGVFDAVKAIAKLVLSDLKKG